jgi:type IV secretion system protein VirD4
MRRAVLFVSPLIVAAVWTVTASLVTLWGLGTLELVGWPTWQWWGYLITAMPDAGTQERVNQWLLTGSIAGTLTAASLAYRIISDSNVMFGRGGRALFGSLKYATPKDGRKAGLIYVRRPRPDCILLGRTAGLVGRFWRYVCLPGVQHVIVYAKTGSGKGVAYVIANCFNYTDSLVVLDLKNENYRATAGHRAAVLGQEVFRFSPLDKNGATHCWNPLGGIDASQPDYISKLQQRAFSFFPETYGKEKFWQDGARSAFLGISILVCETPGMPLNPARVFRFFTSGSGTDELIRLIEAARQARQPYTQTCVDLISDYLNGTDEVVKGIRKHVTSTMGLWFNPKIAAATEHSDFSLGDLRRKRMTIYIGVMPADLEQLGVLLRLLFLQLFEANTDVMPQEDSTITHRCHVLLDEFTAIPVMRTIAEAVGFARGFGLQFSFVVQSKNQIQEKYRNNGAASLLENAGAEIVFGTDNHQLCKEVSERAGYDTVENISRTTPRFFSLFRAREQNENTSQTRRALILPQEVSGLPQTEEIMFRASAPPFRLKRLCWYRDASFKNLKQTPADLPTVRYKLALDDGSIQLSHGKIA